MKKEIQPHPSWLEGVQSLKSSNRKLLDNTEKLAKATEKFAKICENCQGLPEKGGPQSFGAMVWKPYNKSEGKAVKKKKKKRKSSSSSESDESSEQKSSADSDDKLNKKVQALEKDMERMRKEFKSMKGTTSRMEEGEIWCTDYKEKGHAKGACPKKAMCDICQVLGHSMECPYNMKTWSQ